MPWWVACFETIIFVNIFLDAGGPRSRCKVRSHCGHSKNDYICSCSYSLSQAQSVHSVWSNFFLDGLESTSWGPIPQFRRMVEGRVLILRLNFLFSVQNFIELYNRNVKSSRKHDRSQWTRCNGGIPHVPQRYTKRRDTEKCNLKNQRTESLTLLTVVDRDSHYVSYITAAVEAFLFGKKVPEQALTGFDNVALCYRVLQCLATNGKTLPTTVWYNLSY